MTICRVYVPVGALGAGIDEADIARAMEKGADVIAVDAGSTDSGPFYLGNSKTKYARKSLKHDLRLMIVNGRKRNIPVIVGSCGTCGTDEGVDMYYEISEEILREEGLQAKIARIYTQQSPLQMKERYLAGDISALAGAPDIDADTFERCTNIVALAGAEPFIQALKDGADIILCGRATDTAVIAAYPLLNGVDPGIAWHAAKIVECGSLCANKADLGGVLVTFEEDNATIESSSDENSCSVYSVSAHLLYENADPLCLVEPGICIYTKDAIYEQIDEKRVRISGSRYETAPYTLKLEGARHAGYQTITLVGIRDRQIMKVPEIWLQKVEQFALSRMRKAGFDMDGLSYSLRAYGWNATYGGDVPVGFVPNELGVLLTVTAATQAAATQIAKAFNPALLHCPLEPDKPMPSFAFPFSPAEIERGPVYEFTLNHVVAVADPLELVKTVLTV